MRSLLQTALSCFPALIVAFEEKLRTRLQSHLVEVEYIITQDDTVGKRLDFMMQELHREDNTIDSKSINLEITRVSMELKVIIEQMQEHPQKIK